MSFIVGTGTTITEYLCALWLGYPVPLCAVLTAPMFMALMVGRVAAAWGKFLKENKEVFLELQHFQTVISIIFSLAFIDPASNYAFVRLGSSQQSWLAFLLPVIKLVVKNGASPFYKYIEDEKPEAVIVNVQVFHAFFVAICMQSATSFRTTAVLMLIDFVHAWVSLYGISLKTSRIQNVRAKVMHTHREFVKRGLYCYLSQLPGHVFFLVKSNPRLQEMHHIRVSSRWATRATHSALASWTITPCR